MSDEAPYTGDIEIRVHGVSGTPPQELLGRGDVTLEAGDRVAGFYRPAQPTWQRDTTAGAEGPWLEGYSWGGWTSGARSRGLWLLLAPFALINVAPHMLAPEPPGAHVLRRLRLAAAALLRVIAVSLTCTLVLGVAVVSATTVAGRCAAEPGARPGCSGLPRVITGLLGRLDPASRLGVCALIPLGLVVLLWVISRASARRYSRGSAPRNSRDALSTGRPDDDPMPLAAPDLFVAGAAAGRLRALHAQAGIATALGTLAWIFPGSALRTTSLAVIGALFAAIVIGVAFRPPVPRILRPVRALGGALLALAGVLVGLLVAADPPAQALNPDRLVIAADSLVKGLFIAQGVMLLVVLALVVAARAGGAGRGRDMFAGGYSAVVLAFIAYLFGSMLTASVLILGPSWLGTPGFALTPGRVAAMLATHPGWFGSTSRSAGIGMLVGAALFVLIALATAGALIRARLSGGGRVDRTAVRRTYLGGREPDDPETAARASSIGFVFFVGRIVNAIPTVLAAFAAVVTVFLGVQLAAVMAVSGRPAASGLFAFVLGRTVPGCDPGDAGVLACPGPSAVAWGAFGVAGLLAALALLGVACYRTRAMRRGVGVLWDLSCFWPRDTHPFAPPCYNERIMPEVGERLRFYLGDQQTETIAAGGRVVLAGHSQGSVIAFTAALAQSAETRSRMGVLTCGCVLDRLYARFFPRYFGPDVFAELAARLAGPTGTRWINLWRRSDYLGGAVPYDLEAGTTAVARDPGPSGPAAGPVNLECIDPAFGKASGNILYPVAGRHSDFWTDPQFGPQVAALLRSVRARPAVRLPEASD